MNPLDQAFRAQFGDAYPTRRAEAEAFMERALQNALVMRWVGSLSPAFLAAVVANRAAVLNCPIAEIDPTFQGPDEIDWLWHSYRATIRLFADDEL
jgi:hypothetical protein